MGEGRKGGRAESSRGGYVWHLLHKSVADTLKTADLFLSMVLCYSRVFTSLPCFNKLLLHDLQLFRRRVSHLLLRILLYTGELHFMFLCHAMSCHVMSCHAMPCHVMPCMKTATAQETWRRINHTSCEAGMNACGRRTAHGQTRVLKTHLRRIV